MGVGHALQTQRLHFWRCVLLQWVICSFIVCRITAVTALTFSNEQLLSARIYSRRRLAGMNKVSCSSSREGEKVHRTEYCCLIVGYLQISNCWQLRAECVTMQVMFNLPAPSLRQGVYGVRRKVLVPVQEVILLSLQTTVTKWLNKKHFPPVALPEFFADTLHNKSREVGEDSWWILDALEADSSCKLLEFEIICVCYNSSSNFKKPFCALSQAAPRGASLHIPAHSSSSLSNDTDWVFRG